MSGFGYGVSSGIISGAVEYIYSINLPEIKISNYLVLRPFRTTPDLETVAWTDRLRNYREEIVEYAGAAVFLFGNKLQDGQVVLSNGIAEEFDICKERGIAVIPVGATGFMADHLYKRVMADFSRYFPKRPEECKPLMDILGNRDASPQELIDAINRILKLREHD